MRKEEELFGKYKKFEDFQRAWKEYEETLEDKTPLWSLQSFENYIQPLFHKLFRKPRNWKPMEAWNYFYQDFPKKLVDMGFLAPEKSKGSENYKLKAK